MQELFDLTGRVAVVTGGGGVLCGAMAKALAKSGAKVAVLDLRESAALKVAGEIKTAGGAAIAVKCDVLEKESIAGARDKVRTEFGEVDILINGAGGNRKEASTSEELSFFDLPTEAFRSVVDLNFLGTFLCCQVFGKDMAQRKRGVILNISSMTALSPLTKVAAYGAAKAAVSNFTQWLSTHILQNYSADIRVNAVAPGFFLGEQNRYLLMNEDGSLTERGGTIISQTPMGRFGKPEDLLGTVLWLVSDASKFVSGIVVPVDGGYSAFGGV